MTRAKRALPRQSPLPLVVDVDGALLKRDLNRTILLSAIWQAPLRLKHHWQGGRPDLCAANLALSLPEHELGVEFNRDLQALIATHQRQGGEVYLQGQSQAGMLENLAYHFGIAAQILGADLENRLDRARQRRICVALFGEHGFIYAGGSLSSMEQCLDARETYLVDGPSGLKGRFSTRGARLNILPPPQWAPITFPLSRIASQISRQGRITAGQMASRALWQDEYEKTRPLQGALETPDPKAEDRQAG